MRLYWLILLLSVGINARAQQGGYFMTHFTPPFLDRSYQIFDMEQDEMGIMYFAHRGGVLIFDGVSWHNAQAPGSIFTIDFDANNNLLAGGPQGIFRLEKAAGEKRTFIPIHDPELIKDVIDLRVIDTVLHAISSTEFYRYNLNSKEVLRVDHESGEALESLYEFEGEIQVLATSGRTYRIEGDRMVKSNYPFPEPLKFIQPDPKKEHVLVSTMDNQLVLHNGRAKKLLANPVDRRDMEYLRQNEIIDAQWVTDSLAVISTLKGGVVFINPMTSGRQRQVRKVVNQASSLPDDQIFNMFVDNENAVWVNHDRGLTRIDPNSPLQRYDHLPGLQGELKSAIRFKGELFVGTTEGLYKLTETPVFETIYTKQSQWVDETVTPTRKGFFKRVFRKKEEAKTITTRKDVVKKSKEFHSIKSEFVPVKGISTKILAFHVMHGKLYAAGIGGVYEIQTKKAKNLIGLPVSNLYQSKNELYAVTLEGDVYQLGAKNAELIELTEPVFHILSQDTREFFIGMHTVFYRDSPVDDFERIPFQNPFFAKTYGFIHNDEVHLMNHSYAGKVDFEKGEVLEDSLLSTPDRMIAAANGQIWARLEGKWQSSGIKADEEFRHMQLLQGIEYIAEDPNSGKWIVTSNGVDEDALYHLASEVAYGWQTPNSLYIRKVHTNLGDYALEGPLEFGPEHTTITFNFGQPEYSQLINTEYRYYLEGQKENYSDWSPDNSTLQLTYLPAGKYTLRVQSRNSLGQQDELNSIEFEVSSPYWKQTWFYAVEFAIIALMLLLSLRMKSTRYFWISRLLALLTLITIIELIQAVAESKFETETSPVIGFIAQVMVAFMILPFEEIVRKYIFKGSDAKFIDIIKQLPTKSRRPEEVHAD